MISSRTPRDTITALRLTQPRSPRTAGHARSSRDTWVVDEAKSPRSLPPLGIRLTQGDGEKHHTKIDIYLSDGR